MKSRNLNYYLKSNMDRFIVCPFGVRSVHSRYLKSNMDRFIAAKRPLICSKKLFKIQYG